LAHLGISVRLLSFHEHNRAARIPRILDALTDGDVAIVTDAGTPSVSDPGQALVAAARGAGYAVVAVPGASALAASLMVAGIVADFSHFVGFLPRKSNDRRRLLAMAATWPGAVVFFEAPHRLVDALSDAVEAFGDRPASVCNDLTKRFERVWHARLSDLLATFRTDAPRGEFTVVVAPAPVEARDEGASPMPDATTMRARFDALMAATGDRREAMRRLALETGYPRKEVYGRVVAGRAHAPRE
jgi:16S rRNA (cytidine1402-2'-O)-methyltransferase